METGKHMAVLRLSYGDTRVAIMVACYVLLLAFLSLLLPETEFQLTFSESGPFERGAIAAWLAAALLIVVRIRPLGMRAWGFVLLFIIFAAREADLNKAFTAGGMLKINYYRNAVAPPAEKLIAGVVAVMAIALLIYAGAVIVRFLFLQGGWRSRAGLWLFFSVSVLVFSKVLDRMPAVLAEDYGLALPLIVLHYLNAYEEGLEMLVPLTWLWSIWISRTEEPYLF